MLPIFASHSYDAVLYSFAELPCVVLTTTFACAEGVAVSRIHLDQQGRHDHEPYAHPCVPLSPGTLGGKLCAGTKHILLSCQQHCLIYYLYYIYYTILYYIYLYYYLI